MAKSIQQWFDEYGESHQNPTNKTIHWICIPLIFWSIIGLLACIPHNYLQIASAGWALPYMHWGSVVIALGLLFYIRLSWQLFLGMALFSSAVLLSIKALMTLGTNALLITSVAVFVGAWIGQFIGHNIEGKKPSFFKDLQFLMIGPAWLMGFILKRTGIGY